MLLRGRLLDGSAHHHATSNAHPSRSSTSSFWRLPFPGQTGFPTSGVAAGCSARPEACRAQQYPPVVVVVVDVATADPFDDLDRQVACLAAGIDQPGEAEGFQLRLPRVRTSETGMGPHTCPWLAQRPPVFSHDLANDFVSRFLKVSQDVKVRDMISAAGAHACEVSDNPSRSVDGLSGTERGDAVLTLSRETPRAQERRQDTRSDVGNERLVGEYGLKGRKSLGIIKASKNDSCSCVKHCVVTLFRQIRKTFRHYRRLTTNHFMKAAG